VEYSPGAGAAQAALAAKPGDRADPEEAAAAVAVAAIINSGSTSPPAAD